jgi:hypothetical protein
VKIIGYPVISNNEVIIFILYFIPNLKSRTLPQGKIKVNY